MPCCGGGKGGGAPGGGEGPGSAPDPEGLGEAAGVASEGPLSRYFCGTDSSSGQTEWLQGELPSQKANKALQSGAPQG